MFTRLAVLGSLVAALCVLAAPALGKGTPHADSSITLNQGGTSLAQTAPQLGGTVRFTALFPAASRSRAWKSSVTRTASSLRRGRFPDGHVPARR